MQNLEIQMERKEENDRLKQQLYEIKLENGKLKEDIAANVRKYLKKIMLAKKKLQIQMERK